MAAASNSPTPSSRRGFFRQMVISAMDTAEQVGRAMGRPHPWLEAWSEPDPPPYEAPEWSWQAPEHSVYGPPWPPTYGPPIPRPLRAKLRDRHAEGAHSRESGGEAVAEGESGETPAV